jgi:hypothetical protein
VRNWTLDGSGFERLLLELRRLIANGELAVSPKGELLVGEKRQPLSARQRLAFHRLISKAEALASQH